ncbi:carbohydrate ABC transporter permease [Agromyces sp. ISL-38]|uniref:carbohydrate ABC transporter permease n=1 Tax=Agromyces sp. ISL-38 TaxID=2819107 RepID=UPI001BE90EA5|nr:carbohydrate ABC transporter permease [Agromyces sp. ISL-38]MBT2497652.1 carbohydrate ABC transporter permease [Agromyces sp. ISL-38]MBT2517265.1 carbohydrate ABC transporter permease [Streptomyces sp. ISL-90]
MTIIPTPVVDEQGHRETVEVEKKTRRKAAVSGERPKRQVLITIVMGIIAVAWLLPLLGLLITGFRSKADVDATGWWTVLLNPFGQDWTVQAFSDAWVALDAGTTFWNSVAVTVPATILPVMIAAMAAYAFTFFQFRGKEIYFAIILSLMVVPIQLAIIPVLQLFVWFGNATGIQIIGQYPAAWIVHATFAMPLAIYILRNYMQTLPNSLIEAARVDGASHFQIFWRLIVPMSVPALASFAIFQFLWVWNDFLVAYIFIQSGPNQVLTQGLYTLLGQYGQGWQRVAAGSFITLVVPLLIFFALQRFFVRGLTAGSVK